MAENQAISSVYGGYLGVANGHGGIRAGSGRPARAPKLLARQILEAAERYCAGIGGDPRAELSREDRWQRYLVQVGEAGRQAAGRDLAEAVQVSFAMLSKAHSAGAEDEAGDAIRGGVSRLLAALDHREVPSGSQPLGIEEEDSGAAWDAEGRAPEPESGGQSIGAVQLGFGMAIDGDSAGGASGGRERATSGHGAAGEGGSPPPPLPAPATRVEVDPQNFDFGVERTDERGATV